MDEPYMYVRFLPSQNILKHFPVKHRCISLEDAAPACVRLARQLADFFQAPVKINSGNRQAAAFRIGRIKSDLDWRQLPQALQAARPASFVSILPDTCWPQIWIGGCGKSGLMDTVLFMKKIFALLFAKHLIAADFHIHTTVSDGLTKPEDLLCALGGARLDACAVTDHNSRQGAEQARLAGPSPIPILTGQEFTDSRKNHVLIIGANYELKGKDCAQVLALNRRNDVFISQAHATDQAYFQAGGTSAVSAEAYNFLSSAPQLGRDYINRCLKKGLAIAALGNSDAHLTEDIGKARTFAALDVFSEQALLAALKKGATVAFWRGYFTGAQPLCDALKYIYAHSNLLDGKLLPLGKIPYYGLTLLEKYGRAKIILDGEAYAAIPNIPRCGIFRNIARAILTFDAGGRTFILGPRAASAYCLPPGAPRTIFVPPADDSGNPGLEISALAGGVPLKPHTLDRKVFCRFARCGCRETAYDLRPFGRTLAIKLGNSFRTMLAINNVSKDITAFSGLDMDVLPLLKKGGVNDLTFKFGNPGRAGLRLLYGRELGDWEIRGANDKKFKKVFPASNLQIQQIAPKDFQGTFYYRTRVKINRAAGRRLALLFNGIDGEIEILVQGRSLLCRGMNHWEDSLEIPIPEDIVKPDMRVEIVLNNQVGLCGITNNAYLVDSVRLDRFKTRLTLPPVLDVGLLRCNEARVRALFLNEAFQIVDQKLVSGEMVLVNAEKARWLAINSMRPPNHFCKPKAYSIRSPMHGNI